MRLSILSLLFLACCTSTRAVPIATGASIDLLDPETFGCGIALEQTIESNWGGQVASMDCVLEIDSESIRLVGLTPVGSTSFSIIYNGKEVWVDDRTSGRLPADPRRILAALQLAQWPELPTLSGLTLVESRENGGRVRRLISNTRVVVSVTYAATGAPWLGPIDFVHHELDYSLHIETVRWERLAP